MPNRLADETSPYLLQHKDNPVDWWPWGEAALAEARRREVPIFLSVGYSACHWCHVMEHESFENEAIAAVMNEHFVNIKVDREERPDIDALYMTAVQLMAGQGGWPMSVFLTPDARPFFGGTYWPPTAKFGRPGFREVLLHIHDAWTSRREEVEQAATGSTDALTRLADPLDATQQSPVTASLIGEAAAALLAVADRAEGGFGAAPKFPHPMDIRVLLRAAATTESPQADDALAVATLTLDKMAAGGLYDHLGGGFHRYSTDARWLVPHFEKMLYDQALLLPAYLEAWQLLPAGDNRRVRYEEVIRETLDYLEREMIAPGGAYAATQDADSFDEHGHSEEGAFFVWTREDVLQALSDVGLGDAFEAVAAFYDITEAGNWEGKTILNRPHALAEVAGDLGETPEVVRDHLMAARAALFEARAARQPPGRDEKVLTSWNGLMIAAAARCGAAVGQFEAVERAARAADFLWENLRRDDGRLLHCFKDGRARFDAALDDYAAFIEGLCELYQATFESRRLTQALELAETMREQFSDPEGGAFFYTGRDHEELIARRKDVQDNAVPSASGLAATALLKLGLLTGRGDLIDRGEAELAALSPLLSRHPQAAGQALIAAALLTGPARELVVAGDRDGQLLDELRRRFLPAVVLLSPVGDPGPADALLIGKTADEPTLFICERGTCRAPVAGVEAALAALD